ncbi:MAG: exodeoxyribonuclease VII large subunit [Deltaproteobacteria bacterium]|jgi:exodeoxyribonuclease VII large subunit|nr:exodeoxyribonuclease VII large subunit [Deltaproteobacteria bacterium]
MEDIQREQLVFTVSELTKLIKVTLEDNFYNIRIKGEISGLKTNYSSGYYFDIKDEFAKLKCIIFKSDLRKIRCELKEGMSVTVYGRLNLYEPRGEYSFIVSEIEPFGYGELYVMFERLKEKLKKEGLFDESRKRTIPFLPERIGIVTSRNGAVLHDMVKIITSRFENVSIIFANASVQGLNAAAEIAGAIELLNKYSNSERKIDVIIVGRGGGSIEDLWAFNEEITARAIYNSKIPIISAVGHETDFTIADFVADRRASTPSNAAEMAVPVKSELIRQLKSLTVRLKSAAVKAISNKKNSLSRLIQNIEKVSPKRLIENKKIRINDLVENMHELIDGKINLLNINISHLRKRLFLKNPLNILKERRLYINGLSEKLEKSALSRILNYRNRINTEKKALNSLSPYKVLKRGYSITFSEQNTVVSSVSQVKENENLILLLSDGRLKTKVLSAAKNASD